MQDLLDSRDPDGAGPLPALYRTRTYENGRLKSETDEHGNETSYTYDGEGNILSKTDDLGATSYEYDGGNKVSGTVLPATGNGS